MTSTESTSTFRTILAELSDPSNRRGDLGNYHTPFHLASLADCYSPDGDDSPGAQFLASIARDVAERIGSGDPDDDRARLADLTDGGDAAHEIADGAVPIYTHDRWQTFVDLGAYNEDVTEYGDMDDLTNAAGVALYMIARRLVVALAEELSSALDEDAEDDAEELPEGSAYGGEDDRGPIILHGL